MAADTTNHGMLLGGGGGEDVSLLEILDHVLNSGVVIHGSLVISLAGVDLVYVGLNVVLTSVETARLSAQNRRYVAGPMPRDRRAKRSR